MTAEILKGTIFGIILLWTNFFCVLNIDFLIPLQTSGFIIPRNIQWNSLSIPQIPDINEIYTRIFHHRHFINGEIDYFLNEFEVSLFGHVISTKKNNQTILNQKWIQSFQSKRGDREIENLFNAVQSTIDSRDTSIEKCRNLSESNLPLLKIKLDETLALCENVLTRDENTEAVNVISKFDTISALDF